RAPHAPAHAPPLALTTARNVVRMPLRPRRRHACVRVGGLAGPYGDGMFFEGTLHAPHEPPSRPIERAEVVVIVRAAVSGLGDRQRIALEMHQFQNRTCAEIAAE